MVRVRLFVCALVYLMPLSQSYGL